MDDVLADDDHINSYIFRVFGEIQMRVLATKTTICFKLRIIPAHFPSAADEIFFTDRNPI